MRRTLAVPLLLLASSAAAQGTPSLSLAADVGPAFPLGEFADDGARVGWGLGVSATVRLTRLFGLYGSYERTSFDVEEAASPGDGTWTDTGLGVGAQIWFPVGDQARIHPWARLGLGWHDLDPPIAGPEFARLDSDRIRTVEGGAGLDIALARQLLFLRPMLRYRRYSFEVESAGGTSSTSISALTLGLGLMVAVGPGGGGAPSTRGAGGLSREGTGWSAPGPR
jgi:hypothetical protein